MELPSIDDTKTHRSRAWKWWVCGLLLLATMLLYMDRMTLNQTADRILKEFKLDEADYGNVLAAFSLAFAVGAPILGAAVDKWNVFWIYPIVLMAWSLAGFATGFVTGLTGLFVCRFFLGLAESGNWPCALRTTQRILLPAERGMGNGILQSGAAIGAIITPQVVLGFLYWTGDWRYPFMVIGGAGVFWVVLWFRVIKPTDLALPRKNLEAPSGKEAEQENIWASLRAIWSDRRFWVLVLLAVSINISWHFFANWLPLFLQRGRGYSEKDTQHFTSAYYLATDLGSLSAGFLTLWLSRIGFSVHRGRQIAFLLFSLLASLSVVAALLDPGPLLLAVLLVIGFGALGVFPLYYSLSQELTVRHQGKLTGMLSSSCWLAVAALHHFVGDQIKETQSYTEAVALAGLAPLIGFAGLILFWRDVPKETRPDTLADVRS